MPSRKNVIEKALGEVYSSTGKTKGTMIESCAEWIDDKWDGWADSTRRDGRSYEVHMCIWNFFPGGGTAEIAARKVMEAVNANT